MKNPNCESTVKRHPFQLATVCCLGAALSLVLGACATETKYGKKRYKSAEFLEKVDHSWGVVLGQETKYDPVDK